MATTIVSREELGSMPRGVGAEEALRFVPGVKVDNQANGERVHLSIRGIGILTERGIRGVKVLLDGIPLNDPTGFAPDLFDVDWRTVQRIEVLRGPAAALYGGGSAGGVISIVTRNGPMATASPAGAIDVGSNAFWKALAEVGGASGQLNYRLTASRATGDGWREHTRFDATNVFGKVTWAPSSAVSMTGIVAGTSFFNDNAEGLNLDWIQSDADWAKANPDALKYNEYQRTQRVTSGLSGRAEITPAQTLTFALYYRLTGYEETVPSSVLRRTLNSPGAMLQYRLKTGQGWLRNQVAVGGDFDQQAIDENRQYNMPVGGWSDEEKKGLDLFKPYLALQTVAQRGLGLYLLDRLELGPAVGITGSIRYDYVSSSLRDLLKDRDVDLSDARSFEKATGRVGLTWNPLPALGLYASWGTGFLPPATEEMMANPDALGGFNQRLIPATSMGEEVGARGVIHDRLVYDVTLFHLATENDFYRFRVPGPTRRLETFYGNAGTTRRLGVEACVVLKPVAGLSLRATYTLSQFVYTSLTLPVPVLDENGNPVTDSTGAPVVDQVDYRGNALPNTPVHQANVDVEYAIPLLRGLVAGVGVDIASRAYVDWTNVPSIGGYVLVNPRLAYRFKVGGYAGELMASSRNVLAQPWIAFTEPDPDGNSYQPGPRREVFASVRFGL